MFGYRRELNKYDEVDEDELLASLSLEEIQELEQELDDLDPDTDIPIGLRQKDQTAKPPGEAFNREALLKYWEEENKKLLEEANTEQKEPTDRSIEGELETSTNNNISKTVDKKKIPLKAKKVPNGSVQKASLKDEVGKKNECTQDLKTKTSMKSSRSKPEDKKIELSADRPSGNPIVTEKALEQIIHNDPALIEVNLNNIEDISQDTLLRFTEALCTNMHVQLFSLANTHADDRVALAIAKMLQENASIKNVNIESNFVSGQGILAILGALHQNRTLVELRFHNQRHICGGKVEMEMVQLLRENSTLLKLGYQFDLPGPRMAATSILTRNQDQQRQKRLQERKEQEQEVPKQVKSQSVECRPQKKPTQLAKNGERTKKYPTNPPQEVPKRKMAEMVKQCQEVSNKTQPNQKKPKTKKLKNGANEKESVDILKELRNSLKPSVKRPEDPSRPPPPPKNSRDDLMAAIRGSSAMTLKRVDLPKT